MEKLAKDNAVFVLNVLGGRLAFERTGVKLYDAVIAQIDRSGEPRYHAIVDQLREIRNEEKEHEEWLEEQIRALGGDAHEVTEMAQLEMSESSGIAGVIEGGDRKILHLIHALLAAELADNAGWDVLVKLADETGDRMAKLQFAKRLAEEAKHLLFIREVVLRAAEIEILGRETELPRDMRGVGVSMLRRSAGLAAAVVIGAGALATSAVLLRRRAA
jgi:bacterioferritin (cytochrome b1)